MCGSRGTFHTPPLHVLVAWSGSEGIIDVGGSVKDSGKVEGEERNGCLDHEFDIFTYRTERAVRAVSLLHLNERSPFI